MLTPAMFAIFNFLGVWSYRITDSVIPIAALYEAFAFVAILFMILAYTLPSSGKLDDQIAFFQQHPRLGYRDFRRIYWRMVQFLPVTLICVIATEITMATNCVGGRSWKRANLVIHIVEEISTVLAITGLFKGYNKLKLDMKKVQAWDLRPDLHLQGHRLPTAGSRLAHQHPQSDRRTQPNEHHKLQRRQPWFGALHGMLRGLDHLIGNALLLRLKKTWR